MNFRVIKRTLGWLLLFEAIFLLLPTVTAVAYWEKEFFIFLISATVCAGVGGLCLIGKLKNGSIYAKEGFVIVALSWIVMSLFGALPFFLYFRQNYEWNLVDTVVNAVFETASGFTTTGSSILSGEQIDGMAKSVLMWRSFTHWVGGMGVLVFIMAFLPLSGARNMYMMKAESPGPTVGKLVPKVRTTAMILYAIYSAMTLAEFVFLLCGGMPVFDALNTAFATAGTGGFSVKSTGMAGYNSYLQIVVTVFMLLFSINFNAYYMIGKRRWKEVLTAEVKAFLIIVALAITGITLNVFLTDTLTSFGGALKHSAFTVASVISTTGFATEAFEHWPAFSQTVLVLLMFIGACAGSTGGGMKVSRMLIMGKGATNEVRRMLHPKQVRKITMDKRVVDHEVVRSVNAYFMAFVLIFVGSLLVVSLEGKDMVTNFTSVVTTLNNIGPGLGEVVGTQGSFASFHWWTKLVFIFDMLAGRLEIFPMLVLFSPWTWKK